MAQPKRFTVCCSANGCTFLRENLTRREADREACNHQNAYHHDVVVVQTNLNRVRTEEK